jgi:hypothetical protein
MKSALCHFRGCYVNLNHEQCGQDHGRLPVDHGGGGPAEVDSNTRQPGQASLAKTYMAALLSELTGNPGMIHCTALAVSRIYFSSETRS